MKAHELARRLLAGPNIRVVVEGYDGGADDLNHIEVVRLRLNHGKASYNGQHGLDPDARAQAVMLNHERPKGGRL
jgi:hypothetical protein